MTKQLSIQQKLLQTTDAAPLAAFRFFFGSMMLISMLRFWSKGWIAQLYIKPNFFFSYYGFEWVKPLGNYTYLLFFICGLAALFVALGYKYRIAIVVFFLSFTYIELMDVTNYLNHYYFVSLISFILIFLPANAYFSIDAKLNPDKAYQQIPQYTITVIKLMLAIVYFYAGLAKLNSDWLLRATPLNIWLPIRYDLPLLGQFMPQTWFHYATSWAGALYDLFIPFLLFYKPTRKTAFLLVVVFHIFTAILFPIGMFPYIMIISSLIFFDATVHHKILNFLSTIFRISKTSFNNGKKLIKLPNQQIIIPLLFVFFCVQLLFPFRYVAYPDELFWTEQGYRFSWRVMLIEKAGYAEFKVVDKQKNKTFYIDNKEFLTPTQEKQMSFQPDLILQYAHFLGDRFKNNGVKEPEVYVDSYVTLNGRLSEKFIAPSVNLYPLKDSWKHKDWILPFKDSIKIKGL
ncbi:MAG: HTTM domain-containing protein [Flavobacteriales bacterium]|nr:MAG: HTTM domain-containing protein [Flavobacteriales bacterium]